eukprot:scaffold224886_cov17-Prasinocladus_malaysianus.AAC.2
MNTQVCLKRSRLLQLNAITNTMRIILRWSTGSGTVLRISSRLRHKPVHRVLLQAGQRHANLTHRFALGAVTIKRQLALDHMHTASLIHT